MISVEIFRHERGKINGFTVRNHGKTPVCAAVSMLTINTVNSIETLTKQDFACEYDEKGGYLRFTIDGEPEQDAAILLDAMLLGLRSAKEEYPNELEIKEQD